MMMLRHVVKHRLVLEGQNVVNQFNQLDLQESYISAHTVPTLPNMARASCGDTSVFTPERSHTHVRSVVNVSHSLQIVLLICAQCILLDKLCYISALTVPTLPNIVLGLCSNTSLFTQERSHTHVRSVVNASHSLQIALLTCAQCILLDQLHCINALIVLTLPNIVLGLCGNTFVFTLERSHTHVRSVVNTFHILQVVLLTCAQHTLLNKLHCINVLIVLTLPNVVQTLYGNTSVRTQERNHTHVKSVVNASNILHIELFTCAQHTLLNKLHCISALIVLTLPNMVQALCGNTSVFTPERSHTHVRSVGSASHSLQVIADIYVQCIQRPHLINSIAIPVPAVPIFWSLQNNTCSTQDIIGSCSTVNNINYHTCGV